MNARELYQAGRLGAAIQAIISEVRDNPTDPRRRTFLFELLCFAGEFDRAEKHLEVLSGDSPDAMTGSLLYRAALAAERCRLDLFTAGTYPAAKPDAAPLQGTLNGKPFEDVEDADPRIGPRLEVFAAGQYLWLPLEHLESIEMEAPKRLRDLLWIPALVRTGPGFKGTELGEVLVPALSPRSFRHADEEVKLGRVTAWEEDASGAAIPYGAKCLTVDGEDIPLLELRKLEITAASEANATA